MNLQRHLCIRKFLTSARGLLRIQDRTKALPHYTMPGGLESAVEIPLYECCDVLFNIMKLQSLQKDRTFTATAAESATF